MKHCPICNQKIPKPPPPFCSRCGWDLKNDLTLVPTVGDLPDSVVEEYRQRVALARKNWRERVEFEKRQKALEEELLRLKQKDREGFEREKRLQAEREAMARRLEEERREREARAARAEEPPQLRPPKWRALLTGSIGVLVLGLVVSVMAFFLSSGNENPTPSPKARPDPSTPAPPSSTTPKSFNNALGMEFVYIEPGEFMMGSPPNEPGRGSDERQHKVRLTKGFYMQTTEVTQGQWEDVMGRNPSHFSSCGDDCPVVTVSWNDAQSFIKKLNDRDDSRQYRLPTEAEWEYAARAGTATPFAFGNCLSTNDANYDGNYPLEGCSKGKDRGKTIPVGSLEANAWGLYDMHGNVWEWCLDWYGDYPSGTVTDPVGPANGAFRVHRGGSWLYHAGYCRSACRNRGTPVRRRSILGFRALAVRR